MQPRCSLRLDAIKLGDVDFWSLPIEDREGAFVTLRRERPIVVPRGARGAGARPGAGLLVASRATPTSSTVSRNARALLARRATA